MKQILAVSAALLVAAPALAQSTPPASPDQAPAAEPAAAPEAEAAAAPDAARPARAPATETAAPAAPAAAPAPVVAQAAPAAPAPQCELHVWPAQRFQSVSSGWGGAMFGVLGAVVDAAAHAEGDKARRSQIGAALDSEGQLHALQQLDLQTLLRLPASRIVAHAEALDPKTVNNVLTRRSDSTAPCYNELIVQSVLYTRAAMWGRSLRTTFVFRQFNNGAGNPLIKKTTGGNSLKIFPAKPGTDTTAADAELVDTFKKNFTEATENFARLAGRQN